MSSIPNLSGVRVLIVEDEALVSMLIEDSLSDIGCKAISIATTLNDAMAQALELSYDVAILDVNLNGEHTFPLAEFLISRQTPFIFSTGYGAAGIPENLRHIAILQKPFQEIDLQTALNSALVTYVR